MSDTIHRPMQVRDTLPPSTQDSSHMTLYTHHPQLHHDPNQYHKTPSAIQNYQSFNSPNQASKYLRQTYMEPPRRPRPYISYTVPRLSTIIPQSGKRSSLLGRRPTHRIFAPQAARFPPSATLSLPIFSFLTRPFALGDRLSTSANPIAAHALSTPSLDSDLP